MLDSAIEQLEARLAESTGSSEEAPKAPPVSDDDFETVDTDPILENPEEFEEYIPADVGPGLAASAAGIVRGLSVLLGFFGRKIYAKALLKPGDADIINTVNAKVERVPKERQTEAFNNEINANHETLSAYERSVAFSQAIKGLPLTQEEQELLARPVGNILAHYQVQPGPWGDLIIALFIIMLPRLEPMLPGAGKIIKNLGGDE
jgi:hypothetical protein